MNILTFTEETVHLCLLGWSCVFKVMTILLFTKLEINPLF